WWWTPTSPSPAWCRPGWIGAACRPEPGSCCTGDRWKPGPGTAPTWPTCCTTCWSSRWRPTWGWTPTSSTACSATAQRQRGDRGEQDDGGLQDQQRGARGFGVADPHLAGALRQRNRELVAPRGGQRGFPTVDPGPPPGFVLGGRHQGSAGSPVGDPLRHVRQVGRHLQGAVPRVRGGFGTRFAGQVGPQQRHGAAWPLQSQGGAPVRSEQSRVGKDRNQMRVTVYEN